jgi:hypothetical protein
VWWRRKRAVPATLRPGDPVHVLHVGKTGGTALKAALNAYPPKVELHLHGHRTRLRDVPRGERVVFFVREPLSRYVSAFYSRQRKGQPRYYFEWNRAEERAFAAFATPDELAAALSSPDTALRREAQAAIKGIRHLRSPYAEWFGSERALLRRLDDILLIGFQEELDDDFEILKSLLGMDPHARLPAGDRRAHRNPQDVDKTLSPAAESNLRKWYARDIRFYDFCKRLRAERLHLPADHERQ